MFCPQCRVEYRDGFSRCTDCRVLLVPKLPPPERRESSRLPPLVTILRTGDAFLLGMAKSLLDSEGIRYLAKGETLQDLFGVGRLGFGFSPVVGPVEIQVAQNDAESAR